ncbi:MAG: PASTA domain-containing protein [Bacteroidia bacterium]
MSLIHFLRSKIFWINIVLIVVVIVGLLGFTYKWLDSYTNHGETISVPDLRGYTPEKIAEFLPEKNLRFMVVDSSIFDLNKPKGTVIDQDPKPNAKVKEGRTIYLTITRTVPPTMPMPDLIDVSYRQAEAIFQTYGLQVGELIYKPDLAKNAVLGTIYKGKEIHPGDPVAKGSVIDLILGDGFGNTKMPVPNLINLTAGEAMFVLKASSLNVGGRYFDETVRDSSSARVYKQFPTFGSEDVSQGEAIDLYFTESEEKLYNAQ